MLAEILLFTENFWHSSTRLRQALNRPKLIERIQSTAITRRSSTPLLSLIMPPDLFFSLIIWDNESLIRWLFLFSWCDAYWNPVVCLVSWNSTIAATCSFDSIFYYTTVNREAPLHHLIDTTIFDSGKRPSSAPSPVASLYVILCSGVSTSRYYVSAPPPRRHLFICQFITIIVIWFWAVALRLNCWYYRSYNTVLIVIFCSMETVLAVQSSNAPSLPDWLPLLPKLLV